MRILIAIMVLSLFAGCRSIQEIGGGKPYSKWSDTAEAKFVQKERENIPLPARTQYDRIEDERGIFNHGFITGWLIKQDGNTRAGMSSPPAYTDGNDRLTCIWQDAVVIGTAEAAKHL